jgi:hypothetical protein
MMLSNPKSFYFIFEIHIFITNEAGVIFAIKHSVGYRN